MNNDEMLKKAKKMGALVFKQNYSDITESDIYIVWFSKTLQNWKALVSTDKMIGFYAEITYNGDKHETYIDKYVKTENRCIPDVSKK